MDPTLFLSLGNVIKWIGILCSPLLLLPLILLIIPKFTHPIASRTSAMIDHMTGWVLYAAMAAAVALVFLQLTDVLLTYAYGWSRTWLSELVIYAFATMFMLGASVALRDDAHVRVDILRPRFGLRGRAWVELAGIYLFLFPICIRLLALSEQGLTRSWLLFEGSRESDGLPIVFLFKTLVPAFAMLLIIQGLSEAIKAALVLTGHREDTKPNFAETHHGA
jgi:TRAP-type mannitol/chloroaromatic compound transport system permease small subunit